MRKDTHSDIPEGVIPQSLVPERKFTQAKREQIIRDYLHESGREKYEARDFAEWVRRDPEHPAREWFGNFEDVAGAAENWWVHLAREFKRGIILQWSKEYKVGAAVKITTYDVPAMLSPREDWNKGGGYKLFDPDDPEMVATYCQEAAQRLKEWIKRYEGAAAHVSVSLAPLQKLIEKLRTVGVQ
jgi:hypothetical protein